VDNLRSIIGVMCIMWITPPAPCGVNHIRHAVSRLDFWGYLCYTSSIKKVEKGSQTRKVTKCYNQNAHSVDTLQTHRIDTVLTAQTYRLSLGYGSKW
jgi:hypothetical protein